MGSQRRLLVEPPAPVNPVVEPDAVPHAEPSPAKRGFGQEQLTGPPDTLAGGDVPTAWASATPDGANEWVEAIFAEPVRPIAVFVYESCNPGALAQIELYRDADERVTVWGDDPKPTGTPTRIVNAPVDVEFPVQRVRLSVLSKLIPGWNEIDAVGLLDSSGEMHWAVAAIASSSYAGDSREPLPAR